jgi:hypothetical protein
MFRKFFTKDESSAIADPVSISSTIPEQEWESRLHAARGNDELLMALLKEAPSTALKLLTVTELSGEEALKQAEREFRTHDRRVHSAAKRCYEKFVKRRETRERAAILIEAAAALRGETLIPANRLVELNQAWQGLDSLLLEDSQNKEFADLQILLAEQVREFGERHRTIHRWSGDARSVLARFAEIYSGITNAVSPSNEVIAALSSVRSDAISTLASIPVLSTATNLEAAKVSKIVNEINASIEVSGLVESRLAMLDELQRNIQPPRESGTTIEPVDAAAKGETLFKRWHSLTPIPDQAIANALNSLFDDWMRSQKEVRNKLDAQKQDHLKEMKKAARQDRMQSHIDILDAAEAACATGRLAEAVKHLPALQSVSDMSEAGDVVHARAHSIQAEILRLKGWQHWGGGRVRQELVEEAEVLARSVVAAEATSCGKLPVAQLEKYIDQLRDQWKELDRLRGGTGKTLWDRFDTALKSAALPVQAHKARLAEARLENLSTRQNLLNKLDAITLSNDEHGTAPDWRAIALALSRFNAEWRALGPVEHTVPHKKLASITQRMNASIARLDNPLQEVLQNAQVERESLVVRAKELHRSARDRDVVGKIRELQIHWQTQARSMPLPRAVENALWVEFKAAIDAILNERGAALIARNAELDANQQKRESLIARLQALGPDTAPAEIKSALALVDKEWRSTGEAGKDKSAKLEERFRNARDVARQYLVDSAQRRWNKVCNALVAKLGLCAELEADVHAGRVAVSAIEASWKTLPTLPSLWDRALQARFDTGVNEDSGDIRALAEPLAISDERQNDLLLRLESALNIPSPPSFDAARRSIKLMAMKNALEGRKSAAQAEASVEHMTSAAFGYRHPNVDQKNRLEAIIDALRLCGPSVLESWKATQF